MKKANTKKKSKKASARSYHGTNSLKMLALVLMVVIFSDGIIFGLISSGDINAGLDVLDISMVVSQTTRDVGAVLQPMIDVASSINKFYTLAAAEMVVLLQDNLINNAASLFTNVTAFYETTSRQMMTAMDVSDEMYPNVVYASY